MLQTGKMQHSMEIALSHHLEEQVRVLGRHEDFSLFVFNMFQVNILVLLHLFV